MYNDIHKPSVFMEPAAINRRFSVAPMMEYTDRHERYFLRLISKQALLYTEMITAEAIIHGNSEHLLAFSQSEHPIALQLGGSDPERMSRAAELGQKFGYDEININVGCPSDRVQSGRFGACLMAEPKLVAACVTSMRSVTDVPITIKSRTGIDDQDSYDFLCHFVETTASAGCRSFIIHARKAILSGLSPKQNREIPLLDYQRVYDLKSDYPELEIVINGGINSIDECENHLSFVDGVMLGRAAYQAPYLLAQVDQRLFAKSAPLRSREQLVRSMEPYIKEQMSRGVRLHAITRHMMGLFYGQPGARAWRRHIAENSYRPESNYNLLETALQKVFNQV